MRGGESLSDTDSDWPRLEQLDLVYGESQWSSDLIPGVKFPKQINNNNLPIDGCRMSGSYDQTMDQYHVGTVVLEIWR